MENSNNKERIERNDNQKKEKPTKEKKIKPRYYAGTNVEKLPKIPKKYIEDLESIEALTPTQLEKYLTAVVLGMIPDRFGLEVGMADKLRAIKALDEIRETKLKEQAVQNEEDQATFGIEFVIKQKKQVDDLAVTNDEEDEDVDTSDFENEDVVEDNEANY